MIDSFKGEIKDAQIDDRTDDVVLVNLPAFGAQPAERSAFDEDGDEIDSLEKTIEEDHMDVSSLGDQNFFGKEESKIEKHCEEEFVDQEALMAEMEEMRIL